jgi:hypothetical protein
MGVAASGAPGGRPWTTLTSRSTTTTSKNGQGTPGAAGTRLRVPSPCAGAAGSWHPKGVVDDVVFAQAGAYGERSEGQ